MKVFLDRIEGNTAVLISQEDESQRFNIPLSLLPNGSREGDMFSIRIERDGVATEAAKERVSGLIEKLKKRK
jgi:hypothetical protein